MPQIARIYPGQGFDWRRKVTTHCVNGHPFDDANTYWRGEGWRGCRACNREAVARYQARQTDAA